MSSFDFNGDWDLEILVIDLKAHAVKNYDKGGWDVFVECWSDAQIVEAIGTSRSLPYAKWKIGKMLKTYSDYRAEIMATAF